METSFQAKMLNTSGKAGLVYLVTAMSEGKPAWFYLQVAEPKHKAFKKQIETGALDLTDYGDILYSGWGSTPPAPITAMVREQFEA